MEKSKTILIELPMPVYEDVSALAKREERSVRHTIKRLVEEGLRHVSK